MSDPMPHVLGELSTYLDQQLSNSERQRVEKHLKTCDSCSRHYKDLLALRQMLHESPALKPPDSFYKGVLHRIENQPTAPSWFGWGIPAKALASACVVMIVVWATHEPRHTHAPILLESKISRLQTSDRTEQHAEPVAAMGTLKDMLLVPKSAPTVAAKEMPVIAQVVPAVPPGKKKSENEVAALTQLANTPAPTLAKRQDVQLQARDIHGPATQNSFGGIQEKASVRSAPMTADSISSLETNTPTLAAGAGRRAIKAIELDNLALAPALPEWKGTTSGITVFQTVIINDANQWTTFWHQHTQSMIPPPPVPEIDFTRNRVVGVFAGQKPSSGYSIEITGTQQPADVLVVTYKETSPAPGTITTTILTQPFDLKVIPQNSSLIQFKKE